MAMSGYCFMFTMDELRNLSSSTKAELAKLDGDFADTVGAVTPEVAADTEKKTRSRKKKDDTTGKEVIAPEMNQPNQVSTQYNPYATDTPQSPAAAPAVPQMPSQVPPWSNGMPQMQFPPQQPQQFTANPAQMPPQFQMPQQAQPQQQAPSQQPPQQPQATLPQHQTPGQYVTQTVIPNILSAGPDAYPKIQQVLKTCMERQILQGQHVQFINDANAQHVLNVIKEVTGVG